MINPYKERGPLSPESKIFFGREREIRRIEESITADPPQHVAIVGERKIGKTSLINRLVHNLNKTGRVLSLYINCSGIPGDINSEDEFYNYLDQLLRRTLTGHTSFMHYLGTIDLKMLFDSYRSFHDFFLDEMSKTKNKLPIVIFLDNFEMLTEKIFADHDFFSHLRAVASNPGNRLSIVTITRNELFKLTYDEKYRSIKSSEFWNIFVNEFIGLIDNNAITNMRYYFEEKFFSLSDIEGDKICYYAAGVPLLNNMVLDCIWQWKSEKVSPDWGRLENELNNYYFQLWKGRTDEERLLLKNLKKPEREDKASLSNMESRGIILKKNESYFHFSEYFSTLIEKDILKL